MIHNAETDARRGRPPFRHVGPSNWVNGTDASGVILVPCTGPWLLTTRNDHPGVAFCADCGGELERLQNDGKAE